MKNTESKSRRLEKQVRNLREQMADLSATMETLTGLLRNQKTTEVDRLSYNLEESRDLLYDIKEMLEDKLIIGEPTSSGEVLRIWKQRDPFDNEKMHVWRSSQPGIKRSNCGPWCGKLQPRCASDLSDWFEQAQRLPTFSPLCEIVLSPIWEMVLLRRGENSHLSRSKRRGSQQPCYELC